MTKLFIFNCDDFILDEQGGTFICGKKKFSLKVNSSCLSKKILQHVETKASFFETEYPDSVVAVLFRNNLLRLASDPNDNTCFKRSFTSTRFFLSQFFSKIKRNLETDFVFVFVVSKLRSFFGFVLSKYSGTLLSESNVTKIVRFWAWILHPVGVAFFAIINVLWLMLNFGSSWSNVLSTPALHVINPFIVTVTLLSLFILHEFGHAATAYSITRKCGAIKVHRVLYVFPYLAAQLPTIKECGRVDKFAISASGPIFQILCSILFINAIPKSNSIRYAADISIVIALINFIPTKYTDGYWMLVELLQGVTPKWTVKWSKARKIDITYTVLISIFVLAAMALFFFLL
jgi:hypothetical protein